MTQPGKLETSGDPVSEGQEKSKRTSIDSPKAAQPSCLSEGFTCLFRKKNERNNSLEDPPIANQNREDKHGVRGKNRKVFGGRTFWLPCIAPAEKTDRGEQKNEQMDNTDDQVNQTVPEEELKPYSKASFLRRIRGYRLMKEKDATGREKFDMNTSKEGPLVEEHQEKQLGLDENAMEPKSQGENVKKFVQKERLEENSSYEVKQETPLSTEQGHGLKEQDNHGKKTDLKNIVHEKDAWAENESNKRKYLPEQECRINKVVQLENELREQGNQENVLMGQKRKDLTEHEYRINKVEQVENKLPEQGNQENVVTGQKDVLESSTKPVIYSGTKVSQQDGQQGEVLQQENSMTDQEVNNPRIQESVNEKSEHNEVKDKGKSGVMTNEQLENELPEQENQESVMTGQKDVLESGTKPVKYSGNEVSEQGGQPGGVLQQENSMTDQEVNTSRVQESRNEKSEHSEVKHKGKSGVMTNEQLENELPEQGNQENVLTGKKDVLESGTKPVKYWGTEVSEQGGQPGGVLQQKNSMKDQEVNTSRVQESMNEKSENKGKARDMTNKLPGQEQTVKGETNPENEPNNSTVKENMKGRKVDVRTELSEQENLELSEQGSYTEKVGEVKQVFLDEKSYVEATGDLRSSCVAKDGGSEKNTVVTPARLLPENELGEKVAAPANYVQEKGINEEKTAKDHVLKEDNHEEKGEPENHFKKQNSHHETVTECPTEQHSHTEKEEKAEDQFLEQDRPQELELCCVDKCGQLENAREKELNQNSHAKKQTGSGSLEQSVENEGEPSDNIQFCTEPGEKPRSQLIEHCLGNEKEQGGQLLREFKENKEESTEQCMETEGEPRDQLLKQFTEHDGEPRAQLLEQCTDHGAESGDQSLEQCVETEGEPREQLLKQFIEHDGEPRAHILGQCTDHGAESGDQSLEQCVETEGEPRDQLLKQFTEHDGESKAQLLRQCKDHGTEPKDQFLEQCMEYEGESRDNKLGQGKEHREETRDNCTEEIANLVKVIHEEDKSVKMFTNTTCATMSDEPHIPECQETLHNNQKTNQEDQHDGNNAMIECKDTEWKSLQVEVKGMVQWLVEEASDKLTCFTEECHNTE